MGLCQRHVQERGPQIKGYGDSLGQHRDEQAEAWAESAVRMTQEVASRAKVLEQLLRL